MKMHPDGDGGNAPRELVTFHCIEALSRLDSAVASTTGKLSTISSVELESCIQELRLRVTKTCNMHLSLRTTGKKCIGHLLNCTKGNGLALSELREGCLMALTASELAQDLHIQRQVDSVDATLASLQLSDVTRLAWRMRTLLDAVAAKSDRLRFSTLKEAIALEVSMVRELVCEAIRSSVTDQHRTTGKSAVEERLLHPYLEQDFFLRQLRFSISRLAKSMRSAAAHQDAFHPDCSFGNDGRFIGVLDRLLAEDVVCAAAMHQEAEWLVSWCLSVAEASRNQDDREDLKERCQSILHTIAMMHDDHEHRCENTSCDTTLFRRSLEALERSANATILRHLARTVAASADPLKNLLLLLTAPSPQPQKTVQDAVAQFSAHLQDLGVCTRLAIFCLSNVANNMALRLRWQLLQLSGQELLRLVNQTWSPAWPHPNSNSDTKDTKFGHIAQFWALQLRSLHSILLDSVDPTAFSALAEDEVRSLARANHITLSEAAMAVRTAEMAIDLCWQAEKGHNDDVNANGTVPMLLGSCERACWEVRAALSNLATDGSGRMTSTKKRLIVLASKLSELNGCLATSGDASVRGSTLGASISAPAFSH